MSFPNPATLMRHRPPALLLDRIEAREDGVLRCAGATGTWPWPRLLEGAAQTAGLLAGLQPDGPGDTALVAEYRDVDILVPVHEGAVTFEARLDRRILRYHRGRVVARAADGSVLLRGSVALVAGPEATR